MLRCIPIILGLCPTGCETQPTGGGVSGDGPAPGDPSASACERTLDILAGWQQPGRCGLPDPSAVYCRERGGTLSIEEGEEGQYGICILTDGTRVGMWELFCTECQAEAFCMPKSYDVGEK